MMKLQKLLAQFPTGAVESVVCLERHPAAFWVVGKVYKIVLDNLGREVIEDGGIIYREVSLAKFGVHQLRTGQVPIGSFYQINPHIKDGKLPTLITGFNPNKVVADDLAVRSYEDIESLIRVGIDVQDALATNAPDLDRALVELWFELKGAKK